jgi:hypothetical protein
MPGKFQEKNAQTECRLCDVQTFTDMSGRERCALCATGKRAENTGSTFCQDCQAGEFGKSCAKCPRGWFRHQDDDAATCKACPQGKHQNSTGSALCVSVQDWRAHVFTISCGSLTFLAFPFFFPISLFSPTHTFNEAEMHSWI